MCKNDCKLNSKLSRRKRMNLKCIPPFEVVPTPYKQSSVRSAKRCAQAVTGF